MKRTLERERSLKAGAPANPGRNNQGPREEDQSRYRIGPTGIGSGAVSPSKPEGSTNEAPLLVLKMTSGEGAAARGSS